MAAVKHRQAATCQAPERTTFLLRPHEFRIGRPELPLLRILRLLLAAERLAALQSLQRARNYQQSGVYVQATTPPIDQQDI